MLLQINPLRRHSKTICLICSKRHQSCRARTFQCLERSTTRDTTLHLFRGHTGSRHKSTSRTYRVFVMPHVAGRQFRDRNIINFIIE